jgi:NTE family protein
MRNCPFAAVAACLTVALAGCSPVKLDYGKKLGSYEYQEPAARGYGSIPLRDRACNADDTQLHIAFSGGGTRAAALAYGVLKELKETFVKTPRVASPQPSAYPPPPGRNELHNACDADPHSLLYEIDVIRAVSGGSFTALAYGLYGENLMSPCGSLIKAVESLPPEGSVQDRRKPFRPAYPESLKRDCAQNPDRSLFEWQFLKHDVQNALILRFVNPMNWARLAFTNIGRSDLAAGYYDDILFQNATYHDLVEAESPPQKPRPRILVSATEATSGARIVFGQDAFASWCSDLNKMSLARSAAASSAFPVWLSPITIENFAGSCTFGIDEYLRSAYELQGNAELPARARSRVKEIQRIEKAEQRGPVIRYLHLVDGGVTDNLGVRSILENLEVQTNSENGLRGPFKDAKKLAVIIVNAGTEGNSEWGSLKSPPILFSQIEQSAFIPIDRYTREEIDLLKDIGSTWKSKPVGKSSEFYGIVVSFDEIKDIGKRKYFMNLPTNLHLEEDVINNPTPGDLTPDPVDNLVDLGRKLLRNSCEFQRLVQDMGGKPCRDGGCKEPCK